jgi:Peptidoglycan-synthase activator LpoB
MPIVSQSHHPARRTGRFADRGRILVLIAALVWLGAGCQKPIKPSGAELLLPEGVKRVLVLSFRNMAKIYGENTSIRSPLSGKVFYTGAVKKGSEELLADKLVSLLEQRGQFQLIPPDQAEGLVLDPAAIASSDESERHLVQEMGRQLSADAVFVGHLYRFQDRIGAKYASDSPASVAFDLNLVRVADGRLLWSGSFDETQQALNENLFLLGRFLKRKGSWITAEEMALTAMTDQIERLPESQGKGR